MGGQNKTLEKTGMTCEKKISIVVSVGAEDVDYAGVLLCEILRLSRSEDAYKFYLLHSALSDRQQEQFRALITQFPNAEIELISMPDWLLSLGCDAEQPIMDESFYSLFAPFCIDNEPDKLIVLDCRCLVLRDIAQLLETDFTNHSVMAALDPMAIGDYYNAESLTGCYFDKYLKLRRPDCYFSAAVIAVDSRRYKKTYSIEEIKELFSVHKWENGGNDIWNVLAQGDVQFLNPAWNYVDIYKSPSVGYIPREIYEEFDKAGFGPALVHFKKNDIFQSEYAPRFWEYARNTGFYERLLNRSFSQYATIDAEAAARELDKKHKQRRAVKKKNRVPLFGWSPFLEPNYDSQGTIIPLFGLQRIELQIMREFQQFCDENNLRYYLAGGTLLGAVRHEGFIPWDDDIDLLMPRPDYMKFLEMTKDGLNGLEVRSIYSSKRNHICHIARVLDTRYMSKISKKMYGVPYFQPPWIDIFPMDGLPADEEESNRHFERVKRLRELLARTWKPVRYLPGSKLRKAIKAVLFAPLKLYGYNRLMRKIERVTMKYPYDESEYVGAVGCGQGLVERMPRERVFGKSVNMRFEDCVFRAPEGYDYYLKSLYADYMALPPAEKRKHHVERTWRIER